MYDLSHKFPKGYKQYKVMRMIEKQGSASYTEIIKMAYELSHGLGSFDPVINRGYWSGPFQVDSGHQYYGRKVDGWITKLCEKRSDGRYVLKSSNLTNKTYTALCGKFAGMGNKEAKHYHKNPAAAPWNYKPKAKLKKVNPDNTPKPEKDMFSMMAAEGTRFDRSYCNRIKCTNGMVLHNTGIKLESPEVTMRGLKLDDEVIYYRKKTGETGEGYISSITTYSKKVVNQNCFSIANGHGFIKGIGYVESGDMFLESTGDEIQIIKKV